MSTTPLFAVPVLDKWLIHSPLHELSALVNQGALDYLAGRHNSPVGKELADLQRALFAKPEQSPNLKQGSFDPQLLAVITTRGCNIDCVYCDFGGSTSETQRLDPALAVKAIDWTASQLVANKHTEFCLHVFGGEPFTSPELVEIIVHRTRAVCAELGLRPHLEVSTNGVFGESQATWAGDYFDSIVLSFDGPPKFHNRNRPSIGGRDTFRIVSKTAERLSRLSAELCLRVCVTGESVSYMPEITHWMTTTYRPAVINLEPLTENELTRCARLSAPDPFEFVLNWMKSKHLAAAYGVRVVYSATESSSPRVSSCPVGSDAIILAPDGAINACYLQPGDWVKRGMDLNVGRITIQDGVIFNCDQVEQMRRMIISKPRCQGCFCKWSCAGGCHVSNTYPGCDKGYVKFCLQTRLITACMLLETLDRHDLVAALLADHKAMNTLATHSCDAIELASLSSNGT